MRPLKGKLDCSKCPPNRGHNNKARIVNYPIRKDKRVQQVRLKREIKKINL